MEFFERWKYLHEFHISGLNESHIQDGLCHMVIHQYNMRVEHPNGYFKYHGEREEKKSNTRIRTQTRHNLINLYSSAHMFITIQQWKRDIHTHSHTFMHQYQPENGVLFSDYGIFTLRAWFCEDREKMMYGNAFIELETTWTKTVWVFTQEWNIIHIHTYIAMASNVMEKLDKHFIRSTKLIFNGTLCSHARLLPK